jgi:hypothetical protein
MDPRVDVTATALQQEFEMEKKVIDLVAVTYTFHQQAVKLREAVADAQKKLEPKPDAADTVTAVKAFDQKVSKVQGAAGGGGPRGGGKPTPTFALLNREIASLATTVDGQDAAPTPAMQTAYTDYCHDVSTTVQSWNELIQNDLTALNDQLRKQSIAPLAASPLTVPAACR